MFSFLNSKEKQLREAAEGGDREKVRQILSWGKVEVNSQDKYGNTALILAAMNGRNEICGMILSKGCNVDIQDKDGNTALMIACRENLTDSVRVLLCQNADFSIRNNDGRTAINFAKNSDIHKLFEIQIRWNRRKALMIMLAENGYIHSPSSTSLTISGPPLRFVNVFSNEGLLRLIVSYL